MRLFQSAGALADYLDSPDYEPPVDGLHLLQQYIRAPLPLITRAEFVGGRFMYAVEVDTSDGFELCPADVCVVGDAFCPAGPGAEPNQPRAKFTIIDDIDPSLKRRYEAFLAANEIGVAGIEFITDGAGAVYTYDVNTNTNYNPDAETRAGRSGMDTLARYLGAELGRLYRRTQRGRVTELRQRLWLPSPARSATEGEALARRFKEVKMLARSVRGNVSSSISR